MSFRLGQVVKYKNEKSLYRIVKYTKGCVDIRPLQSDASYTIINVNTKLLTRAEYKPLLLTRRQYNALVIAFSDYQNLTLYISAENKQLRKILSDWSPLSVVKCYTSQQGSIPLFVHICDVDNVIHTVTKNGKKMPAFKLRLSECYGLDI